MSYTSRRTESSSGVPSHGGGSQPGPYESPRRVLRGYDEPAPERPAEEGEAPTRASGRERGRR